jgi:predicted NBD/HSP70 family sugar kinase
VNFPLKQKQAILFDLGGTHLRCALTDALGGIAHPQKIRIESVVHGQDPDTVCGLVLDHMTRYERNARTWISSDDPIVLSFPGPIEGKRNILSAPTLFGKGSTSFDVPLELHARTGREIHILNDVSAAAWYLSSRISADRFMVITVSSGIGSKIFDRNHRSGVLDSPPYSGEIGHVRVDDSPSAAQCDCGGIGHLGAIASGRGIERAARRLARHRLDHFVQSACSLRFHGVPEHLTNEDHIVPAARGGDEWALGVVRDCTRPLAKVLLSVTLATGLEKIVLIGGFALQLGPIYLRLLNELLREASDYGVIANCLPDLVQLGEADEEACLYGAAAYARAEVFGEK